MNTRRGITVNDDGSLAVTTDAVTTAAQYVEGMAVTNGELHTIDATSGVPAGALYRSGIARSANGAVYTTTATPSSGLFYRGFAVSSDGALHITTTAPSSSLFSGGVAASSAGAMFVNGAVAITAGAATWAANVLTVTGTSTIDLSSGRFGAYVSLGEGVAADAVTGFWMDGAGTTAGAQSFTATKAAIEALTGAIPASNAVINVAVGYSLTDPAVTIVLATNDVTAEVTGAAISGTETVGQTLTGSFTIIVGPDGQSVTYDWTNNTSATTVDTDTSYTLAASDEGDTLTFTVTSAGATGTDTTGAITAATQYLIPGAYLNISGSGVEYLAPGYYINT